MEFKEEQLAKRLAKFSTFFVLNFSEKFRLDKKVHLWNIELIFFTLLVLKLSKFNSDKDKQFSNIDDISTTSLVSKFDKSIFFR